MWQAAKRKIEADRMLGVDMKKARALIGTLNRLTKLKRRPQD
jgi:hypothetical protein